MAISTFTAGIYNDTLIMLAEFCVKFTFKINRVRTGETVKQNSILAISHTHLFMG